MGQVAIFRSHVGYSRETTYGSSGALGTRYIPTQSFDPGWEDVLERVYDKGIRGAASMDFASYAGTAQSRGGYTHYFLPDLAGIFLLGIFGGEVVTGATAPFIHTFGSTDGPPSWSVYDFHGPAGNSERKILGTQLERVDLAFSRANGAMTVKTSWVGTASTSTGETTDTYSTEPAYRGWEAQTTIAGATNARLIDLNLSLARKVDLIWAGNNTQVPNAREVGPLEVTGTLSMYGSTFTEYSQFGANTSTDLDITLVDSTNTLRIVLSAMNIESAKLDRGGPYARWDIAFRGLHNTTDSGPARMVLTVQSSCGF